MLQQSGIHGPPSSSTVCPGLKHPPFSVALTRLPVCTSVSHHCLSVNYQPRGVIILCSWLWLIVRLAVFLTTAKTSFYFWSRYDYPTAIYCVVVRRRLYSMLAVAKSTITPSTKVTAGAWHPEVTASRKLYEGPRPIASHGTPSVCSPV